MRTGAHKGRSALLAADRLIVCDSKRDDGGREAVPARSEDGGPKRLHDGASQETNCELKAEEGDSASSPELSRSSKQHDSCRLDCTAHCTRLHLQAAAKPTRRHANHCHRSPLPAARTFFLSEYMLPPSCSIRCCCPNSAASSPRLDIRRCCSVGRSVSGCRDHGAETVMMAAARILISRRPDMTRH